MARPSVTPPRGAVGLAALLLAATLACSQLTPGAATATPAQPASATSAGSTATAAATSAPPTDTAAPALTDTPLAISTQPGELILEQPIVFGPGTVIYTDTLAGLASLTSYTAQLVVTFAGTNNGQAEQWSTTYQLQASNAQPARQWTITTTGAVENPGPRYRAELLGTVYERRGEAAACQASAAEPGQALGGGLELAAFLTGVIGADEAGAETINGVATSHATFDQRALGEDGLTQATGELWIATDGEYLVKYLLTSAGGAEYFGEGLDGTLTLDYALTSVNQPVTIAAPADCPPGVVQAPLLSDAANVVNVPGLLAYDTASSVADASAFYQAQLPTLGWTLDGEPAEAEAVTALRFRQGNQQLTVSLSTGAAQTTVTLALEKVIE